MSDSPAAAAPPPGEKIAVNIGILGHIDSGKTSLCRALSTVTSTASLDKHPQSQQRGITLDLGFTSFSSPTPSHWQCVANSEIQFCLVDCPGHASLIKTVLGGAQIIDLCCLVLDAQKGMQTQSAECLVVAELLTDNLLVVVNKIDLVPEDAREEHLRKMVLKLRNTIAKTRFAPERVTFCCVSAVAKIGLEELIANVKNNLAKPVRGGSEQPFLFAFDHVFPIKGQGTVMTGTVLRGAVKPGALVDIPALGEDGRGKKVRSLQIFKKSAKNAKQGDRVAMCVPQINAALLERGLVTDPKRAIPRMTAMIAVVERLSYFKHDVPSKAKFHLTVGHQTVMAKAFFFCPQVLFLKKDQQSLLAGAQQAALPGVGGQSESCKTEFAHLGQGVLVSEKVREWPSVFDKTRTYVHLDQAFSPKPEVTFAYTSGEEITLALKTPQASNRSGSPSARAKAAVGATTSPTSNISGINEEGAPAAFSPSRRSSDVDATPQAATAGADRKVHSGSAILLETPATTTTAPSASASPVAKGDASSGAAIASSAAAAVGSDSDSSTKTCLLMSSRGLIRDVHGLYYVNGRLQDEKRQPLNAAMSLDSHLPVRKKDEILYQLYYLCKRAGVPFRFDTDSEDVTRKKSGSGRRKSVGEEAAVTPKDEENDGEDKADKKKKKKKKRDRNDAGESDIEEEGDDADAADPDKDGKKKKKKKKERKNKTGDEEEDLADDGEGEADENDSDGGDDGEKKKKKKKKKDRKSRRDSAAEDDEEAASDDELEDDGDGDAESNPERKKKKKKKKKDRKSRADGASDAEENEDLDLEDDDLLSDDQREKKKKKKKKKKSKKHRREQSSSSSSDDDSEVELAPDVTAQQDADPASPAAGSSKNNADPRARGAAKAVDLPEFLHLPASDRARSSPVCYVYLELEQHMQIPEDSLLIGSKLDFDTHSPNCRIAFFGRMLSHFNHDNFKTPVESVIDVVKTREKVGILDRMDKNDANCFIVKEMFTKDTDLTLFLGLRVMHEASGTVGVIESSFGVEGFVKVRFERELKNLRYDKKGIHVVAGGQGGESITRVLLHFKKSSAGGKNRVSQ